MKKTRFLLLAEVFIIILLLSCQGNRGGKDLKNSTGIPEFNGVDFSGRKYTERDLKGHLTVLSFINSWCRPCALELVSLEQLYRSTRDNGGSITVLAVTYEGKDEFEALLDTLELGIPIVQVDSLIFYQFGIQGIPTRIMMEQDQIIIREEGYSPLGAAEFQERVFEKLAIIPKPRDN
ncbi:TlpA family protein disulfide reductase [bacterium]|nr:TlpA family protein disulfide reductase [bacterium]